MRKFHLKEVTSILLCLSILVAVFNLCVIATGGTVNNSTGGSTVPEIPKKLLAVTNQMPFYGAVFENNERLDDLTQDEYGNPGFGHTDLRLKGSSVKLEACPEEKCFFIEWNIIDSRGVIHISKNKILHLTMDQDYSVVALFGIETLEGEPAITFDMTEYKKDPNDTELAGKMELYRDPYYHDINEYGFQGIGLARAVDGQRNVNNQIKKGMYFMDDGLVAQQIFRNKNTLYLDYYAYNGISETTINGYHYNVVTAKISIGADYKALFVSHNGEPLLLKGGTTGTYEFLVGDTDSYGNPNPSFVITTNVNPDATAENISDCEDVLYMGSIQIKQTGVCWTEASTDYEIWIPTITPSLFDPDDYAITIMPFVRNKPEPNDPPPHPLALEDFKTEDPALGGAVGKPVYSFGMSLLKGIVKKYEDQTETRDLKIDTELILRIADDQGLISEPTGLSYISKLVGEGTRYYSCDTYAVMHTIAPTARYVAKNQEAKTLNGVTGLTYDIYRLFYYFDLEIEGEIYTICQYIDLPYEGIKYGCSEKALALQRMYFDGAPEGVSEVTKVESGKPVIKHKVTGSPEKIDLANRMDEAMKNSNQPIVSGDILTSAALEKNKTVTHAQAVEALKALKADANGNTTKIVVRQYMNVEVTDISEGTDGKKTISVEITPQSQTFATSTDVENDAIITEGEGQNAVNIGQPETLTVNEPVTITLALPEGYAQDGEIIYVKHTKSTGEEYIYEGVVSGGGTVLTFVSEHGLSPFVIGVEEPAAQIGNTCYDTLEKAIEAVDAFGTVKIVKNITVTSPIVINKTVAIDMNGKTFTFDGNGCIIAEDGANLLLKGDGVFTQNTNSTVSAILVAKGTASVLIENGTFNAKTACLQSEGTSEIIISGGTFNSEATCITVKAQSKLQISNGTFDGKTSYIVADDTSTAEISGGKFIKNKPNDTMIKANHKVVKNGENWVVIKIIAELKGYSITLTDLIGVNFYMNFPNGFNASTDYIKVSLPNGKSKDIPINDMVKEQNGTYRITCPMVAKEMTDKIKLECYINNKLEFSGEYSVEDYAKVIIKNEENKYDANTVEMVRAMLNYGTAAQLYFGYKTDTLANACLTQEQKIVPEATFDDTYAFIPITKENSIMGIEYAFSALDLDSNLGIKHYFTLNGDVETYDYQIKMLDGDKIAYGEKLPDRERGKFCIEIKNICPQNLDKTYKLQVSHSSGKIIIEYSPYTYARMVKNLPQGQMEPLKDLMDAMDAYRIAAQNYVSQQNQGGK